MKKKKYPLSLILLAVFGALFLYVKLFEKGAKKEEGQVQVFALDKNAVTKIVLKKDKKEIMLVKEGEKWFVSPGRMLARKDTVDGMLDELADFTAEQKLGGELKDLKVFALDKPKYSFSAYTGTMESASVIFGENAPVGGMVYMKEDKKPAMYSMMSYRAEKFNKTALDLREMRLLFFENEALTGMTIKTKNEEFVLEKSGEAWRLKKPREKIMKETPAALANILQFLQAQSFAEDNPKDLKKYALDNPNYFITLNSKGLIQTLAVSAKGKVYAKSSENPSVAVVGEENLRKVDEVLQEAKKVEKKEEKKSETKPLTPAAKMK